MAGLTFKNGVLFSKVFLLVSHVIKSDSPLVTAREARKFGMPMTETGKLSLMTGLTSLIADGLQIVTVAVMLLMALRTLGTVSF